MQNCVKKHYRVEQNIEVLKTLAKKENVTPETLKNYSGWGGLRDAVYNPDIYKELKSHLSEDEIDSIKRTLSSAYYTPCILILSLVNNYKILGTASRRLVYCCTP
jgi:hypothetical protein